MAKLESIYISGIRSYGINKADAQTLSFHSPVTLILGQNGCGKTTIIECIRHSLTGDFPAGKSGHMFVSDPNLHRMQSVKGCIKLKFQDVHGNPATISRTLKLDAIGGKMSFKSVDSTYEYVDRSGQVRQLSVKLADCKDMVTSLIGVPETILNNVLFCHQEDSLWPLSEDGAVKKKFDMIFDSSKYDAAVDSLKKKVKERSEMLKNLNKELLILSEMKDNVKLKRRNLDEKEENLRQLGNETTDLINSLPPTRSQLNHILGIEKSFLKLHTLRNSKENELTSNKILQTSLQELIKFQFEGSDDDLENEIANFHHRFQEKKKQVSDIERKISQIKSDSEQIATRQQNNTSQLAGLKVEIKNYACKVEQRDGSVRDLLADYKRTATCDVYKNIHDLNTQLAAENAAFETKETEIAALEAALQVEEVDTAQDMLMKVRSEIALKRLELEAAANSKRITDSQLEELSASDTEFKNLQRRIGRTESEIENLLASFNEDSITRSIDRNRKKVRELNELLEELETDMLVLMKNSYIDKEIDNLRSDLRSKESDIRTLKNKHHIEFKRLFPSGVPTKSIKSAVDESQSKYFKSLRTLKENLAAKERHVAITDSNLRHSTKELCNLQKELMEGKALIENLCGGQNFEEKCKEVAKQNERLQKEKGQLSSCRIIYKEFLKDVKEKKCCPVCETNFATNLATLAKLESSMHAKIEKIPDRLTVVDRNLELGECLHNDLLKLNPVYKKIGDLHAQIPNAQANIDGIKGGMELGRQVLDNMNREIGQQQKIYDSCLLVAGSAALIDQHAEDIAKAEAKIEDLKCKMITVESKRTKAATEVLMHETKEDIKKLGEENDRLNKKIGTNQKLLHDLRSQKSDLVDSQLQLQRLVHAKPQLIEKQKELEEKQRKLQMDIETAEAQLNSATSAVEEAKAKLKNLKEQHKGQLSSIANRLQQHKSKLKDIQKLDNEIKAIAVKDLTAVSSNIESEIGKLAADLEELEKQGQRYLIQRDHLKDELRDEDSNATSLQNNKKLRQYQKLELTIKKEIESISKELGEQTYPTLEREKIKLQTKIIETESALSNIKGQMKAIQANIDDILDELKRFSKDPVKLYTGKLAEIKFEKCIIEDYTNMMIHLSNGLSKFHRQQLLSINLRLRDLWIAVYQGNDIDYIQIESGETEMGKRNRVFNYCVMQKKGDVMMHMRGKCSAGQKVLACLLIRIVLAEHFSAQCGIFALDEPTTNLDRENIRSLSRSIAMLISSHQGQRNFQFLIITHDEEFLNALREVDDMGQYYKVTRNQHGRTIITSEQK